MNRRDCVIISFILIGIVIVGLVAYFDYISNSAVVNTPSPGILPPIYNINLPENINASQDTTQKVNLTFTSTKQLSSEIAIHIENLTIVSYTSAISYAVNLSLPWSASAQETVFNYSFSLTQLTLQPNMSNSTIITINLADNATVGSYTLQINCVSFVYASNWEPEQEGTYSDIVPLVMVVTPDEAFWEEKSIEV